MNNRFLGIALLLVAISSIILAPTLGWPRMLLVFASITAPAVLAAVVFLERAHKAYVRDIERDFSFIFDERREP